MTKKKENTQDIQSELIEQLFRKNGGPQALFEKGDLFEQCSKRNRYLRISSLSFWHLLLTTIS